MMCHPPSTTFQKTLVEGRNQPKQYQHSPQFPFNRHLQAAMATSAAAGSAAPVGVAGISPAFLGEAIGGAAAGNVSGFKATPVDASGVLADTFFLDVFYFDASAGNGKLPTTLVCKVSVTLSRGISGGLNPSAIHSTNSAIHPRHPEFPGRPRGPQHVRAACTREPHAPSQQLIVLRPVRRSWAAVGRGWDLDESQNCCVNRRIITYSREGAGLSPCLSHATWLTNRSHPVKQDYH